MVAHGVDIDPDAIVAADDNAARNGLTAEFSTRPLQTVDQGFDLVVANIFAEVLVTMAADLHRVCRNRLMLAGILADRAHLVVEALQGFSVVREDRTGDWVYLELVPSGMAEACVAFRAPLYRRRWGPVWFSIPRSLAICCR